MNAPLIRPGLTGGGDVLRATNIACEMHARSRQFALRRRYVRIVPQIISQPPIDERRFRLLPQKERSSKVRAMSARLSVGKWAEHRAAAEFIDRTVKVHGAGVDTIVRALLLYEEYLALKEGPGDAPMDDNGQLLLDAGVRVGSVRNGGRS